MQANDLVMHPEVSDVLRRLKVEGFSDEQNFLQAIQSDMPPGVSTSSIVSARTALVLLERYIARNSIHLDQTDLFVLLTVRESLMAIAAEEAWASETD